MCDLLFMFLPDCFHCLLRPWLPGFSTLLVPGSMVLAVPFLNVTCLSGSEFSALIRCPSNYGFCFYKFRRTFQCWEDSQQTSIAIKKYVFSVKLALNKIPVLGCQKLFFVCFCYKPRFCILLFLMRSLKAILAHGRMGPWGWLAGSPPHELIFLHVPGPFMPEWTHYYTRKR